MRILSTGQESTLGNYLKISKIFFGEDSKATEFIQFKIDNSPSGENEEVIADEEQMVNLLAQMAYIDEFGEVIEDEAIQS